MFLASALPAAISFGSVLLGEQARRMFHHHHDSIPTHPHPPPPHSPNDPGIPPFTYPGGVPPVAPHPGHPGVPMHEFAGPVLYLMGVTLGLVFWGVALWWFVVAFVGNAMAARELGGKGVGVMDIVFGHGESASIIHLF